MKYTLITVHTSLLKGSKRGKLLPKTRFVKTVARIENTKYPIRVIIIKPTEVRRNFVKNFSRIDAGKVRYE